MAFKTVAFLNGMVKETAIRIALPARHCRRCRFRVERREIRLAKSLALWIARTNPAWKMPIGEHFSLDGVALSEAIH